MLGLIVNLEGTDIFVTIKKVGFVNRRVRDNARPSRGGVSITDVVNLTLGNASVAADTRRATSTVVLVTGRLGREAGNAGTRLAPGTIGRSLPRLVVVRSGVGGVGEEGLVPAGLLVSMVGGCILADGIARDAAHATPRAAGVSSATPLLLGPRHLDAEGDDHDALVALVAAGVALLADPTDGAGGTPAIAANPASEEAVAPLGISRDGKDAAALAAGSSLASGALDHGLVLGYLLEEHVGTTTLLGAARTVELAPLEVVAGGLVLAVALLLVLAALGLILLLLLLDLGVMLLESVGGETHGSHVIGEVRDFIGSSSSRCRTAFAPAGADAVLAPVRVGTELPLVLAVLLPGLEFAAAGTSSLGLVGIPVANVGVLPGVEEEVAKLVGRPVGAGSPQLVGSTGGMGKVRHDGTGGVVDVDLDGRGRGGGAIVVVDGRWILLLEVECRADHGPVLDVPALECDGQNITDR